MDGKGLESIRGLQSLDRSGWKEVRGEKYVALPRDELVRIVRALLALAFGSEEAARAALVVAGELRPVVALRPKVDWSWLTGATDEELREAIMGLPVEKRNTLKRMFS